MTVLPLPPRRALAAESDQPIRAGGVAAAAADTLGQDGAADEFPVIARLGAAARHGDGSLVCYRDGPSVARAVHAAAPTHHAGPGANAAGESAHTLREDPAGVQAGSHDTGVVDDLDGATRPAATSAAALADRPASHPAVAAGAAPALGGDPVGRDPGGTDVPAGGRGYAYGTAGASHSAVAARSVSATGDAAIAAGAALTQGENAGRGVPRGVDVAPALDFHGESVAAPAAGAARGIETAGVAAVAAAAALALRRNAGGGGAGGRDGVTAAILDKDAVGNDAEAEIDTTGPGAAGAALTIGPAGIPAAAAGAALEIREDAGGVVPGGRDAAAGHHSGEVTRSAGAPGATLAVRPAGSAARAAAAAASGGENARGRLPAGLNTA